MPLRYKCKVDGLSCSRKPLIIAGGNAEQIAKNQNN